MGQEFCRRDLLRTVGAGAVSTGVIATTRTAAGQTGSGSQWPQPRADAANSSALLGATGPRENPRARWRASLGGDPQSAPIVGAGAVFVAADGTVTAFETDDGSERWSVDFADTGRDAVAFVGGTLYVGARVDDTVVVRALNAADGTEVWTESVGDGRVDALRVANDRVYALSSGDALIVLSRRDGESVWTYEPTEPGSSGVDLQDSLAVAGSVALVLVSFDDGTYGLRAFSGESGTPRWEHRTESTPRDVLASPERDAAYLTTNDGYLAVSLSDGSVLWRTAEEIGRASPSLALDRMLGPNGMLSLEEGQREAEWHIGHWRANATAFADGVLYVCNDGGKVLAYDVQAAEELSRFYVGGDLRTTPAIADGTLYVASDSGALFAVESADGVESPSAALSWDGAVVSSESDSRDDVTGEVHVRNGTELTLDASGSADSDGSVTDYEWYSGAFESPRSGASVTHAFDDLPESDGAFHAVNLVVRDDDGATDGSRLDVHRSQTEATTGYETPTDDDTSGESTPEDLLLSIDYDPAEPTVGDQLTFMASGSVFSDAETVEYEWIIGTDSTVTESRIFEHTFERADEYDIALRVTDDRGRTASTEATVAVTGAEPSDDATARIEVPGTGIHLTNEEALQLSGVGAGVLGVAALAKRTLGGDDEDRDDVGNDPMPGLASDPGGDDENADAGAGDDAETGDEDSDEVVSSASEADQTETGSESPGSTSETSSGASPATRFARDCEAVTSATTDDDSDLLHTYSAHLADESGSVSLLALGPEHATDDEAAGAFTDAAARWASISHNPYIATVYDAGEEPRPWVAFDGGDNLLPDAVDFLDRDQRLRVLDSVFEGLETASLYNVAHNAVRPGAVRVSESAEGVIAELGDWGLERDVRRALGESRVTPYTAPEQIDGGTAPTTDVYRTGLLAYRLLADRDPFADATDLRSAIRDGGLEPPSSVADVPDQFDSVIAAATAPDPAERYDSVADLRDAIRTAFS